MNYQLSQLKPFGVLLKPTRRHTHVSELDKQKLRQLFLEHQIIVLRNFETFNDSHQFSDYCESWGEVSVWPFGKVLELQEQENPQDHIFDHSYVPLHWDGMYRPHVPEYQIFHCVKAPLLGQGGRTTFSNTILALKNAPPEWIKLWNNITGVYKRKMEFYDSKTVSPIITKHPHRDLQVIRYNEPPSIAKGHFVNPPEVEFSGLSTSEVASFHRNIQKALYDQRNFYAHEWQDRDIVITDNFSLLHGREGFTAKSPRHLQRVQVQSNPPLVNSGLESYL